MEATASTRSPSTWYVAQPVLGRRGQEAPHLVPAVVEDQALPVGVEAQPGIGVLEEVRPVELGQRELVGGKVGRHPVEDHADPGAVELVDQRHEVLGVAVATGRGEEPGRLIAPRAVERVLHERQELDVREPAARHVRDQGLGQLCVAEEAARGLRHRGASCPGGPRRWTWAHRGPCAGPGTPSSRRRPTRSQVPQHRTGPRRILGAEGERIGLLEQRRPACVVMANL